VVSQRNGFESIRAKSAAFDSEQAEMERLKSEEASTTEQPVIIAIESSDNALTLASQNESTPVDAVHREHLAEGSTVEAENEPAGSEKSGFEPISELPAMGDMPAIPISVSTREGCEGTSVTFNIDAEIIDGNYLWNFGDGSFSNNPNPVHTYHTAGTYDITLSVTSNKDGLIRTKTMNQLIVINPKPDALFTYEFVGLEEGYPVVAFTNQSRRANQAKWIIADSYSEDINPVQRIESKGVHDIELVVSNEFGCDNRASKRVSLNEDYALMAPTRFSPNGDGVFDTFMPRALSSGEHKFTMSIFQDGELIYQTSDRTKPWDGTLPNGEYAAEGDSFYWSVVLHKYRGDKFYSGQLSVVR
jgi:gliding motility-associated-like protein